MSAAKHTPGPWQVKQLAAYVDTFEIRGPQDSGVMVARTVPWGTAADAPDPSEANARLIAAAPELLEALRQFEKCGTQGGWPGLGEAWTAASAAIAKALGDTSCL